MSKQNIETVKSIMCDAFKRVYDIVLDTEQDFYAVKAADHKLYPNTYYVSISRDSPAYKMCLAMKSGKHTSSRKSRSYTVNVEYRSVWQACWSSQCKSRDNKGRLPLIVYDEFSSSEDEDEDADADYKFAPVPPVTKKRKRT